MNENDENVQPMHEPFETERAIALSKGKMLLLLAGSCLFVALGYCLLQMSDAQIATLRRFNAPWFVRAIGVTSIVFFGFCGLFVCKKLFDQRPGLLLNAQGLYDNASALAAGFIPWSDIAGFGVYEVNGQKMLVVKLHEPKKYIASGNMLRHKINRINTSMCGSPVVISANTLQIGFDELQTTCRHYRAKYGRRTAQEA